MSKKFQVGRKNYNKILNTRERESESENAFAVKILKRAKCKIISGLRVESHRRKEEENCTKVESHLEGVSEKSLSIFPSIFTFSRAFSPSPLKWVSVKNVKTETHILGFSRKATRKISLCKRWKKSSIIIFFGVSSRARPSRWITIGFDSTAENILYILPSVWRTFAFISFSFGSSSSRGKFQHFGQKLTKVSSKIKFLIVFWVKILNFLIKLLDVKTLKSSNRESNFHLQQSIF